MAHVPPLLLRRDAQSKLPQIEGYTISPTVAAASSCLILSYVILGIAPSVYVFASTTNLCYMAAGFYREAVTATDRHSATLLVGQMAGGSLILVLMGASSFAFHRESAVYSPAHTLDILFGWLLVTHVFYVCFSVSLLAFVRFVLPDSLDERGARYMRTALSFSLLVAVTLLMTFYDTFYAHQTEFFFVLGPSAALFGGITRFILVYEDGSLRWHAVGLAVMEVVVALTVVFAAILSQGELLGRRLSRGTDPMGYDFFHGQWHFLLALVTSLLYSRAADAARIVQGTHIVCVCTLPYLDWIAEGLLFTYSLAVIILKEANVEIRTCTIILGVIASGFSVHGIVTVVAWYSGMTVLGDRLITPRSLPPANGYDVLKAGASRRTFSCP